MNKKGFLVVLVVFMFLLLVAGCDNDPEDTDVVGGDPVTISIAAIPGVTAPVKDATAVTAIGASDQFTGTVSWLPALVAGKFAADTAYTATITLTAKDGFKLDGVTANFFTVAGATATNPVNSGVVSAVFPKTAANGGGDPECECDDPCMVEDCDCPECPGPGTVGPGCECNDPCLVEDCDCPECPGLGTVDPGCECNDPCLIEDCDCPECPGPGDGDTSVLNLNGQVWTRSSGNYVHFNGNRSITSTGFWAPDGVGYINIGGSGSIVNGKLNFSIGTPSQLVSIQNFIFGDFRPNNIFDNFNISSADAKFAQFEQILVSGGSLQRWGGDDNSSDGVYYIYVDRNVTLTGTGKTVGSLFITKNLNLNLKTGWNAITYKDETSENNPHTITISTGDSSHARWVLWEY